MLRVTTVHANTAGASARYYSRYLADDGPEGEGQWLGRQADGLGLAGPVSTEDLEALLSGHDPVTGTRLGKPLVDRFDTKGNVIPAVAGFDATFSAPKSLSVWWGLTGDPGLLEAHDLAVRAVLDHLERYGATTRVRVNGSRQHPDVDGLVMAGFRQATSREDDPQLHTHVVISTKVQTPDGRWMALDARYLKRKQRALGGLYQSVLRAELTHCYGVAWEPIVQGQAEIAGMPPELLDAFSKRTAQVDAALDEKLDAFREREGRDPSRWERAALTREAAQDSRATKTGDSASSLADRWIDEAAALGWTPARLTAAVRSAARDTREMDALDLSEVLEQLSTNGSTWTRAEVLRAICDLAPPASQFSGHDWARAIERGCDQVINACVTLDPPDVDGPVRVSDGRSLWLAPIEPYLTHEEVLAQEERILTFAIDAHDQPRRPSLTLERGDLDVLQADAAEAVAGHDPLVLIVGPAGTGKTTALRRAVDDLARQRRPVFGVAPTAKAAKVLGDETGMHADTVAKLLHEWRSGQPGDLHRLPQGTTVVLDEAGMCGTGALDELIRLAVSQRWRLVLLGDPRQLHAVGRGGMFDELCRTGRTHELATIHRFRHRWEQQTSLELRAGRAAALDAYFAYGRVTAGRFDDLAADVARQWIDHTAAGRTVAVVAETNEHVDLLNAAIQEARRVRGQLGSHVVRVAAGETAAIGDTVVTRRNDRTVRTERGEPVRNRDRWEVAGVHADGSITVTHLDGHGTATLDAGYAHDHVRLGYAATAHGRQGDTVDVSLTVVNEATSHRSLYVGATRGRDKNRLLVVVADDADASAARDVLEGVLANERADVPAVTRRRELLHQVPPTEHQRLAGTAAEARRQLQAVQAWADPQLQPLRDATAALDDAKHDLWDARRAHATAPGWRRPFLSLRVGAAGRAVDQATQDLAAAETDAAPILETVRDAEIVVHRADAALTAARLSQRLDQLAVQPPTRSLGHDLGIGR